jgi:phosphatidate cytidylyltransferase
MLRQRLITAAFGIPLLAAAVWFGSWWFVAAILIAAGIALWEFYSMARASKRDPLTYFGIVWGLLFVLSPTLPWSDTIPVLSSLRWSNTIPVLMSSAVLLPLIWLLLNRPRETAFSNLAWTIIGIMYIGWMMSYWVALRGLDDPLQGRIWTFWGLAIVFASDSSAYGVGRWKGKHKLAPAISPSKTWEGAVGGLVGSMVAASAFGALLFPLMGVAPMHWAAGLLMGAVGSVLAQMGDLTGSLLKRNLGVKDSGPRFLPGHGGFLDRISSLMFVGPFLFYGVLGYLGLPF